MNRAAIFVNRWGRQSTLSDPPATVVVLTTHSVEARRRRNAAAMRRVHAASQTHPLPT